MRLHPEWREILKRAWSVRLMLLAAVLSGLEAALPLFGEALPLPPGLFGLLTALTVASAFAARLIAQKGLSDAPTKDQDE